MIVQSIFPSLFGEIAVVSATFIGASIRKSEIVPGTVIIKAVEGKPVEWFMSYLQANGFDTVVVDKLQWRSNTDGTLSVWDK